MAVESGNRLWVWVGLAFGLMLAAWTTLFIFASKHRIEEVPLQTSPVQTK